MRQVHKVALLAGAVLIATVAVAAVLFLNNWISGPSASEKEAQVEHSIKTGLERRVAQAGEKARVEHVGCVQSDSSHWECVARTEIAGETASVPVSVTSDDKRFIWKVGDVGEGPSTANSAARIPSPQSLTWVQVTCREVKRAFAEQDNDWLATAGEAVAVQAVATRPNADMEELAVTGARDLIEICRRASNPDYEPYVAANTALLAGKRP